MNNKNKQLLTKASDRLSFLYIDKARIEQTEYSVEIVQGIYHRELPITTINALLLGPGVSITSAAIRNLGEAGVMICWVGQDMFKFYAYGEAGTNSSKNILKQMQCHESKMKHIEVVRRMYSVRYPNNKLKNKSLEELRGLEGKNVKECYQSLANKYNIIWQGRSYKVNDFESQDNINKSLTTVNQYLYGIINGVVHLMGFSPAIGFIHTGHIQSFIYDLADLYKESITIPIAFQVASEYECGKIEDIRKELQKKLRIAIKEKKLLKQISKDLKFIFDGFDFNIPEIEGMLWDYNNFVKSSINYHEL